MSSTCQPALTLPGAWTLHGLELLSFLPFMLYVGTQHSMKAICELSFLIGSAFSEVRIFSFKKTFFLTYKKLCTFNEYRLCCFGDKCVSMKHSLRSMP